MRSPALPLTLPVREEESQADAEQLATVSEYMLSLSMSLSICTASVTVVTGNYLFNTLFQKQDSSTFKNSGAPITLTL